jgi:hypothetical protein
MIRESAESFRREIDAAIDAGMDSYLENAHGNLAEALLQLGDDHGAAQQQLACLDLRPASPTDVHQAFFLVVAAHLSANRQRWADAVRFQSCADVILERAGFVMYDQDVRRRRGLLDEATQALGHDALVSARDDGRTADPSQIAQEATELLRRVSTDATATDQPPPPEEHHVNGRQ